MGNAVAVYKLWLLSRALRSIVITTFGCFLNSTLCFWEEKKLPFDYVGLQNFPSMIESNALRNCLFLYRWSIDKIYQPSIQLPNMDHQILCLTILAKAFSLSFSMIDTYSTIYAIYPVVKLELVTSYVNCLHGISPSWIAYMYLPTNYLCL